MLLYDFNQEVYENALQEKGREEGREEGEKRFSKLTKSLIDSGRIEDLKKASEDRSFYHALCKEYNI